MGLTLYPQPVQKSTQGYVNAGATFAGGLTTITGTVTQPIAFGSNSGVGSGYQKLTMAGSCTLSWSGTNLSSTYGNMWYAEIANPYSAFSSTVALTINTTVAVTAQPGATTITVTNASGVTAGMFIEGAGEGYSSSLYGATNTVASVSGNVITLTNALPSLATGTTVGGTAIVPGTPILFSYSSPNTIPSGVSFLPLTSTSGLVVGAPLSGGVAAGTTVASIQSNSNVVGLSTPTTATITVGQAVTSSSTLTWGGTIKWHNNVIPTQASSGRSIYQFYTPDGGTTIYGRQIMASLSGL